MWRESAFTKNMDECGRLAEGRTKTRPHCPQPALRLQLRGRRGNGPAQIRLCANVWEGRGIKISTSGWKPFLFVSPNTKRPPIALRRKELLLMTTALKWFYWSGACAEWLWQQFGVWRQEKKIKFWCLRSLLIELKVLPSDSSWCRVKTATKPSLSCNI